MDKKLEHLIREASASQGSPVGMQFTLRVLEDHPDHLDISIEREHSYGESVDIAVTGNQVLIYNEN
jgi:hypothetical protein